MLDLTIVRPWHWGIAVIGLPNAGIPEIGSPTPVSIGVDSVVLLVRHAQDVDVETFEGDWDWATPTIRLRSLVAPDPGDRTVVGQVTLDTRDERISIGDADGEVVVPTPATRIRIMISTSDVSAPMDEVWIDLMPADNV